ncbi:MAG TPA: DUF222 domain-containing protein [Nocardioides sp.]|nr:DUF222 domain-containing protein [Nocardioides sp.]
MVDHSGAAPAGLPALDARVIDVVRRDLSRALDAPSGLTDAARLDAIRALEQLGCVVTAAQALLSTELDVSQRAAQAAEGVPAAQQGRGVAAEVAWARRESPNRGQRHLGLAKAVTTELPMTWRAWREGRISEWKSTLVARETACLTREARLAVDAVVGRDPGRLEAMGVRELVSTVQAEACRIDPASVVARRRHAESESRVTLRPAPDTMTWLTALLPVKQGVAVYAALTRAADQARAAGDSRGKGQAMADSLVGRVLAGDTTEAGSPRVSLELVMTDHDLWGGGDGPAYLTGYGPVPAELAREIVSGACTRRERLWLHRLYARPETGELVATDARARRFPRGLARLIRLRDQVCRTPWCEAPVRQIDHATPHAEGGETSQVNGQGLCEACNHAKQAPNWRAGPSPGADGHVIATTLPTGHRYVSRPRRVLTFIRETPIRLEYVLAG